MLDTIFEIVLAACGMIQGGGRVPLITMTQGTPKQQLDGFIKRFTPEIARLIKASLASLRRKLPGATELVYDNFNALVIGFGPTERASEAIFSIAAYPNWLNLFFLQGARLKDPTKSLKGAGSRVRHIRVDTPAVFDQPAVKALIAQAMAAAPLPINPTAKRALIIKSISPRQRSRRP